MMATRTRAMVNTISETPEGGNRMGLHLGQEEGAGKQGLSPSILSRHQARRRNRDSFGRAGPRKAGRQKKLWQPCLQSLGRLPAALPCSTHMQGAREVPHSPPCWPQAAAWWLIGLSALKEQKTTTLLHSRNCLGRRSMQRNLITGQLN